jgi:hypothetical protein
VISGFNSDIEFQGTVYHVQTEDKGLDTPIILSLVYSRGEILASKRSPYDDLIAAGFDEAELNDRLQRQHKLIIAAIRGGRIDDLKRMTMKESQKRRSSKVKEGQLDIPLIDDSPQPEKIWPETREEKPPEKPQEKPQEKPAPKPVEIEEDPLVIPAEMPRAEPAGVPAGIPSPMSAKEAAPIPRPDDELVVEVPINILEEPFFDEVEVVEYGDLDEETILPAEAVKIITDNVGGGEAEDDDRLKIRLLGRTTFYSGDDTALDILIAHGGKLGKGISGAHIVVKVLGSSFRPLIFHTRADDNGISQIHLQIPEFKSGRAAILIKAIHEGEEIELRQVIIRR